MKVHITSGYHVKNLRSLRSVCSILKLKNVNFEDADIVFSAAKSFDTNKYPTKIFIFGPHFSVLPNNVSHVLIQDPKDKRKKIYNLIYIVNRL